MLSDCHLTALHVLFVARTLSPVALQASLDASSMAPEWSNGGGDFSDDEGPAARTVRELERQLEAAELDALRSVDYSADDAGQADLNQSEHSS